MIEMKNKTIGKYKIGSLILVFLFAGLLSFAQDFPPWPSPTDAAAKINPVEYNKKSLEAGKTMYNLQCKACHGETGKGDGLIKSASLVSDKFVLQSEGSFFWKLQTGRGQMPGFKAIPEDQLWNVINYVLSFTRPEEDIVMKNAVVSLIFNEKGEKKKLKAKVEQIADDGTKTPAKGVKVNLGIKRYFGILPIGTSKSTNSRGEVKVTFPNTIIGDENGELTIIATIDDMEYNPAEATEQIAWGQVNANDYWTERRALWKDNDYVPLWLLVSFVSVSLGIWLVIGYVALLVRKIKIEGDKVS